MNTTKVRDGAVLIGRFWKISLTLSLHLFAKQYNVVGCLHCRFVRVCIYRTDKQKMPQPEAVHKHRL